jgi:putative chitinase
MRLTKHFTLDEFVRSDTAVRKGIDNNPSDSLIEHLKLAALGMEAVRELLQVPILVTSGYRCLALNKTIGGSKSSAHMQGFACDFIAPKYGNALAIVTAIKEAGILVDQCIMEGTWTHISFDPKMRQEFMTATFINGKAIYATFD